MHCGAPAHFSPAVRDVLNNTLIWRWIGRGGPTAWPPRYPDLSPLDFYLWRHPKPLCLQLLLTMKRHFTITLWMSVRQSATTPASLWKRRSMLRCVDVWAESHGGYFEHLLKHTLPATIHKLFPGTCSYGHLPILVCGTRAQNLPAPFN
jgi:hypothetical protein